MNTFVYICIYIYNYYIYTSYPFDSNYLIDTTSQKEREAWELLAGWICTADGFSRSMRFLQAYFGTRRSVSEDRKASRLLIFVLQKQYTIHIRKVAHNAVQWPYTDSRWECKAMHDNIHDESLLMASICYMQTWFCELRTCAHRSGDPGWRLSDSQAKDMPCTSVHLMGIGLLSSLWQVSADSPLEETFELFHATLLIVGTVLMMKFNFR